MCGIACSARGVIADGDELWRPFISILGLAETTLPAVAVDAISLANDADVVVTGGGRRCPW